MFPKKNFENHFENNFFSECPFKPLFVFILLYDVYFICVQSIKFILDPLYLR